MQRVIFLLLVIESRWAAWGGGGRYITESRAHWSRLYWLTVLVNTRMHVYA